MIVHHQEISDRIEDVQFLLDMGEHPAMISERLGIPLNTIFCTLKRDGKPELARLFAREEATDKNRRKYRDGLIPSESHVEWRRQW